LAVRISRRPSGATRRPDAVCRADVLRFADDRGDAELCVDRDFRADPARGGTGHPGPQPRRRIRNERDLSHRDGGRAPSRFLFQLPICDAVRRTDLRAPGAACVAARIPDQRGNPRLGLAYPVLHRGASRRHRAHHAAQSARDRSLRGGAQCRQADLVAAHADAISARSAARCRTDRRRHRGLLRSASPTTRPRW
jgi:hypothetical protein